MWYSCRTLKQGDIYGDMGDCAAWLAYWVGDVILIIVMCDAKAIIIAVIVGVGIYLILQALDI